MEITIKFTDEIARSTEYYLRRRYHSKSSLVKLAKVAILDVAAEEAKEELQEAEKELTE